MRRHVFELVGLAMLAGLLAGCGGSSGYGFQTSNSTYSISNIHFTNGSGQTNVFVVAPTGLPPGPGAPGPLVQVNAVGTYGSQHIIVPNQTFKWTIAFTQAFPTYYASNAAGTQVLCEPAINISGGQLPPIDPFSPTPAIWYQLPGGSYAPLPPNVETSTVYVTAPASATFSVDQTGNAFTNYCMTLTAFGNGVTQSVQVAVTYSK